MRYRVDNVPVVGMGAFMPGLVRNGVSPSAGLMRRVGFPGTMEVAVQDPTVAPWGWDEKTAPSNVAPNAILPTVYVALPDNMGPFAPNGAAAVARFPNDSVLPVPAESFGVVPAPVFRPAKIGGRRVIGWPRTQTTWPSSTGAVT